MRRRRRNREDNTFIVAVGIVLAIAGVAWLFDQWWFILLLIIGGIVAIVGIVYWIIKSMTDD